MEEVAGLQGMLADLLEQFSSSLISEEQYVASVQQIQQQSPEIFEEAINTPIQAFGSFSMPDLPGGNPPPAVAPNQPTGDWDQFTGMLN